MTVRLVPYVKFDGNTRAAIAFYKQALNAEILGQMTYGEMPADPNQPMPAEVKDRIAHAMLKVGESELMFSDSFPGFPYQVGNHMNITMVTNSVEQTQQFFAALAEGGKTVMPLQETFWSPAYGILTDKFGIEWQLTTESNG